MPLLLSEADVRSVLGMPDLIDAMQSVYRTVDAIWRAVGDLTIDLKTALLLRDVAGLSYDEIAETVNATLATVKWRIYKAREEVQRALSREGIVFTTARERTACAVPGAGSHGFS